ncbi:hypothetical protein IBE36_09385, partial [Francisella philomiragia]
TGGIVYRLYLALNMYHIYDTTLKAMQDKNKSLTIAKLKYKKKQPRLTFTFYPKDYDLYDYFCNKVIGESKNEKLRNLITSYKFNKENNNL